MALSESRRKKLEILTRSLATGDIKRAEEMLRARRAGRQRRAPAKPLRLAKAAPGRTARAGGIAYWLIRRTLRDVSDDLADVQREYAAVLRGAGHRFDELAASPALCRIADGAPEGPLFMDIETCGLAGACIFLIGVMTYRDGDLLFEQFLARHYGEEPAILTAFARRLARADSLVTFNGKSFDMTSIRDRAVFHGLALPETPAHCDLLHESRRRWRGDLPNCRLQTIEQHLCRRRRSGDIPGADIPDAYHGWVADGDARPIAAIVHHNLLDLLTMSQILCAVLTGRGPDVDS